MKTLLLLVGIIVCAAGILFAGQGLGFNLFWRRVLALGPEVGLGILLIVIALR